MVAPRPAKMRAVALDLINRLGKSITWAQYANVGTPSTGVVTRTATAYTATISPPVGPTSAYQTNTLLRAGDLEVTIAASGLAFTPTEGDVLTIDSQAWTVVAVTKLYSGSLVAAYTAQIRR